jgi:hypothetical protein
MLIAMADQPDTGQPPPELEGVAGPRTVIDRVAPVFPNGSLRAVLLASPNSGQWMRACSHDATTGPLIVIPGTTAPIDSVVALRFSAPSRRVV